jgi:transposase
MPPNENDKEKLVIDLLKKGYKTREITKMAHVSFSYIKEIRQKLTGEVKEEKDGPKKKPLSTSSQAFKLFLEGKPVSRLPLGLTCHQSRL